MSSTLWCDSALRIFEDSDYTIFSWRQHQPPNQDGLKDPSEPSGLLSPTPSSYGQVPTLHLHKPNETLPAPPAYQNPSYYLFNPSHARAHSPNPTVRRAKSMKSTVSKRGTITSKKTNGTLTDVPPTHKEKFDKFHSENGVRTVMGSIGPVTNGEHYSSHQLVCHCLTSSFSSNVAKIRVQTRLYIQEVCCGQWLHPGRCCARTLWVRRFGEHWQLACHFV